MLEVITHRNSHKPADAGSDKEPHSEKPHVNFVSSQETLDGRNEHFTLGIDGSNSPFAIEQIHCWDRFDAARLDQRVVPILLASSVEENLRPDNSVSFHKFVKLVAVVIEADADDLEAILMKASVGVLDIGQFPPAWLAPSSPKINQYDFATPFSDIEWFAFECRTGQLERLAKQFVASTFAGQVNDRLVQRNEPANLIAYDGPCKKARCQATRSADDTCRFLKT